MSVLARSIFPELRAAFRLLEDPFFGRTPSSAALSSSRRGDQWLGPASAFLSGNYPAVDVREKDNAWEVEAEIPGAKRDDIKVE
jgi:HSP20 family molecular chaperone IbpA